MAAEIFGERFFGYRQEWWHKIGTLFTDIIGTEEAFKRAQLNYTVAKVPLVLDSPWGPVESGGKEQFALVREPVADDPQPRFFATVGRDYGLIQNETIARILQPLSENWPVETVGALGRGERIFVTLRIGAEDVAGDEVREYLLVNECKDGSNALNLAIVHTRVVCANTLAVALGEGTATTLRHEGAVETSLDHEVALLAQIRAAQSGQLLTLRKLAETPVSEEQAASIFKAAYPDRRQPKNRLVGRSLDSFRKDTVEREQLLFKGRYGRFAQEQARTQEFRDACTILYHKINEEFPRIRDTAWAALNAVTELADHAPAGTKPNAERLAAESSGFGLRNAAKAAAFARAVAFVK